MASRRSRKILTAPEEGEALPLPATRPSGAIAPNGSERAFNLDHLFRTEAARLARFFRRRLRDPEEVHDCVQETFARMAGARPATPLANPQAYLQRIARNLAINVMRRPEHEGLAIEAEASTRLEASTPADQSHGIEARELFMLYQQAVDALSSRTREVFLLHRADGLSYKQIAHQLGIGVRTVEYHIAKALAHIDRALTDE